MGSLSTQSGGYVLTPETIKGSETNQSPIHCLPCAPRHGKNRSIPLPQCPMGPRCVVTSFCRKTIHICQGACQGQKEIPHHGPQPTLGQITLLTQHPPRVHRQFHTYQSQQIRIRCSRCLHQEGLLLAVEGRFFLQRRDVRTSSYLNEDQEICENKTHYFQDPNILQFFCLAPDHLQR